MIDEAFYYYSKFDPHDTKTLIYDRRCNCFSNDRGDVIFDINRLLSPNQLFLFRKEIEFSLGEFVYTVPDITNSFLIDIYYAEIY